MGGREDRYAACRIAPANFSAKGTELARVVSRYRNVDLNLIFDEVSSDRMGITG